MEFIGEWDEVKYYDDSISTVCQTTIQAIDSLPNVDTVLIGGMDRGIDYGPLIEFLSESSVANIILMYDTGSRIYSDIEKSYPELLERTKLVDTLEEAVSLAKKLTVKGGTCLLSPAAASYGLFKNFEERGDAFKKYLMKN
jgi:UDP-N-acetylmuramoylalanine--D-glutamate ligase